MAKNNGDVVRIREVYQITARLEEKIDNCVTKDDFDKLVEKVDNLNSWRWKVIGFSGGVGAAFAFITDKFMKGG